MDMHHYLPLNTLSIYTMYYNVVLKIFCQLNGMSFIFSRPHTSPQNGKAERKMCIINNILRTLLAHAYIPPSFWHNALQMETYLHNILPTKKMSLHSSTKIRYQKDPSYSNLRVFGCLCYSLIPSTSRNKLQPQPTPCVFLNFPPNHRGNKCYKLSSRKIFIFRHVIFEENMFPFSTLNAPNTVDYIFLYNESTPFRPSYYYGTPTPNTPTLTNLQSNNSQTPTSSPPSSMPSTNQPSH